MGRAQNKTGGVTTQGRFQAILPSRQTKTLKDIKKERSEEEEGSLLKYGPLAFRLAHYGFDHFATQYEEALAVEDWNDEIRETLTAIPEWAATKAAPAAQSKIAKAANLLEYKTPPVVVSPAIVRAINETVAEHVRHGFPTPEDDPELNEKKMLNIAEFTFIEEAAEHFMKTAITPKINSPFVKKEDLPLILQKAPVSLEEMQSLDQSIWCSLLSDWIANGSDPDTLAEELESAVNEDILDSLTSFS